MAGKFKAAGFAAKRCAFGLATLVVSSFVVFSALYVAPGSPTDFLLDKQQPTPEMVSKLREQYGLDDPFFVRYINWVGDALSGNFGSSALRQRSVGELLSERLPQTIELVSLTFIVVLAVGIPLGIIAAHRKGLVDDGIVLLASVASATPAFVSGVALVAVFSVALGWFPVFGTGEGLIDGIHHLVLPALALSTGWLAIVTQTTRAAIGEELDREHVETARVRGIGASRVFRRHVWRNAVPPIASASALALVGLFTSSALVEVVFQINGVGALLISSVASRDFPVVQAICLLLITLFVVVNTATEVLLRVLNPSTFGDQT